MMKTLFFCFIMMLLLFSTRESYGQSLAIKTGFGTSKVKNLTHYDEPVTIDYSSKRSFQFLLAYEHPISGMYALETSFGFDYKGSKSSYPSDPYNYGNSSQEFGLEVLYLNLPFHFKFFNTTHRFYGLAGPYFGWALKGWVELYPAEGNYIASNESDNGYSFDGELVWEEGDENNFISRTDFGFDYGVGFQTKRWQFEFVAQQGIKNIATHDENTFKNMAVVFNIGYKINL